MLPALNDIHNGKHNVPAFYTSPLKYTPPKRYWNHSIPGLTPWRELSKVKLKDYYLEKIIYPARKKGSIPLRGSIEVGKAKHHSNNRRNKIRTKLATNTLSYITETSRPEEYTKRFGEERGKVLQRLIGVYDFTEQL